MVHRALFLWCSRPRRWLALALAMLLLMGTLALGSPPDPVRAQGTRPGPATISITLIPPGPLHVGESVTVLATVGGPFGAPDDGDVQFFHCGPALSVSGVGCPNGIALGRKVPLTALNSGFASLTSAGLHCFGVQITDSGVYLDTYETSDHACLVAELATPEITTLSAPSGTITADSVIVTDSVTLTGPISTPTGVVRFFLCGPAEVSATGCVAPAGTTVGAATQITVGAAQSVPVPVSVPGRHCWRVEYAGDAAHAAASHTNRISECFTLDVPLIPDEIDETLDVGGDAQRDGEGVFYSASTPDGSVQIHVRDLPPGVQQFDLIFRPLDEPDLGLSPDDQTLVDTALGIASAGEILLLDAATGAKLSATIDLILAPLDGVNVQFLLLLVEQPDGSLSPVEFQADLDGTLRARFTFDLIFIILDMPAPETNLRPGLNALVYTGPQMPADRAFPGGPGRGGGIEALWRFTGFGFEAFFPAVPDLVVPVYRLYDPLFVVTTGAGALMQQGLLSPVRRTVSLRSGDNMVSYTGGGGSILNVVDASVVGRTHAIWVWRDAVNRWLGFFPGAPASVQGISGLALGDVIFIHSNGAVGWDMR